MYFKIIVVSILVTLHSLDRQRAFQPHFSLHPIDHLHRPCLEYNSKYKITIMPRYYCDYCDAYLTHDSVRRFPIPFSQPSNSLLPPTLQPVVRRQHNSGYKHKSNVKSYFMQFNEESQARLIAELNGYPMVRFLVDLLSMVMHA